MIDIALSGLGTRELFTLGVRVKERLSTVDSSALGIKTYVDYFLASFEVYKISFEKLIPSAELISEKDGMRDNYYMAFENHVVNFKYHPDKGMRNAAREIKAVLHRNGHRIRQAPYKVETAALLSIFAEIDKKYKTWLEEMGATFWYNLLREAQAEFESAITQQSNLQAEASKIASATKKKAELVEVLRNLFQFLPLHYEINKQPELEQLIEQLQAEADRF